ncbi:hypothetical protein GSI_03379 [Ganoderma sinense ZZ0214-1]|uniref:Alpha/beta hydrolase fold-3 domain-containing protein n=1 Tax=Ganoderma sinense ZZ0214-1 TaxID=1077348 RepID=A0A2G8SLI0_9APHY|nr:hypothetical protein GSI_03379 [Ganoderma sinense ZZ0214-1]
MAMDSELAEALASDPAYTQPLAPPDGVSLPTFARQQSKAILSPFSKHYGERLPSESEYAVSDSLVPVEGGAIAVRVVGPCVKTGREQFPVLVWIHGGGWLLGDINMDDNHLRTLCVDLKLVVVNVEYRLAPEHLFPTAFEDCYAATKWVAMNASGLPGVSLKKGFLVGGDSAGASLAAAVVLHARDDPFFSESPITGQYLREPAVVHPLAHPDKYRSIMTSFEENADTVLLNSERALDSYQTYGAPPMDPRASPLLAPTHAGLPPTFLQVMGQDPLRDDGLVYEKVLREASVKTKLVRYDGVVHGFYYTFPWISAARKVDSDARDGLRWLLSLAGPS